MRNTLFWILFASWFGLTARIDTASADTSDAEPGQHLFILSGQSNMNGLKPETSFIPTLAQRFGRDNIVVVKDSHGGQPIRRWYRDWETSGNQDPAKVGDLYDALLKKVEPAIEGRSFDSVTFVWMQGERDAREGNASRYAEAFNAVLTQLQTDLDYKPINYVIGRLSDFGTDQDQYPDWQAMRRVQMNLAQSDLRGSWVNTDDLNDGKRGNGRYVENDLHLTVDGYTEFGRRTAVAAIDLIERLDLKSNVAKPKNGSADFYLDLPDVSPPYYRVRYFASGIEDELRYPVRYTLWIPPGVETLRGVIVHQHGCGEGSCRSGLTGAFDLHWQALARQHRCALLSPSYEQPQSEPCYRWCDPRFGSAESFLQGLKDLGELSRHPELPDVPWALWGHSGGATWVGIMTTLYPERVAATWMRSGAAPIEVRDKSPEVKEITMSDTVLTVPMMLNLGTKEGVTVTDGRFAGVWPTQKRFFDAVRSKGGLVAAAVDPLTGHECGNQRYLAIPWMDACLTARLPESIGEPLQSMSQDEAWLAPLLGGEAVAAKALQGDPLKLGWLPNQSIAKAWMQYTRDTHVVDLTPPPPPSDVTAKDGNVVWTANADLESGIQQFIVYRDGEVIAKVPADPKNRFGRPVFQGLQYSDTPAQPLVQMWYSDPSIRSNESDRYRVITINTEGLRSDQ